MWENLEVAGAAAGIQAPGPQEGVRHGSIFSPSALRTVGTNISAPGAELGWGWMTSSLLGWCGGGEAYGLSWSEPSLTQS